MRKYLPLLALLLLPLPAHARSMAADTFWVSNGHLRIGVDNKTGALLSFSDVAQQHEFLKAGTASELWRFDYSPTADRTLGANAARSFSARPGIRTGTAVLEWRDFNLAEAPALRVRVHIDLRPDEPMSDWRIVIDSAGTLPIEQLHFPRVTGIAAMGEGEALLLPRWMGVLARNAPVALYDSAGNGRRVSGDYPGMLSVQVLALYKDGGAGFYASSDDTLAYRKTFAFWGDSADTRGYELVHPLPDPMQPKLHWTPAYAAVLGTFKGDWYTAAERYRDWGTKQRWARESRLKNGQVPKWLLETGMWVWNRGKSPGVIDPAIALADTLRLPVSVFWHWWHHGPYDTSFPDYLPPREGVPSFVDAVKRAHARNVHAITYMNQRLWCLNTPSWTAENAQVAATKERDGRVREEVYNIFDPQHCATMDVTTQKWRDKYTGIADTVLTRYDIDGIYMDQAVTSLVCWDPTHGHPVGGGNYWMQGFDALASQIRSTAPKHELLAGEGAGEPWLPSLDLMLTLQVSQERYTAPGNSGFEVVPLFHFIYHEYGVTYGSYSSLVYPPYDELWPASTAPAEPLKLLDVSFRRQFFLEQARAFVWGQQPTIANFRAGLFKDRPVETEYMMRLARLRMKVLDYLLYGRNLRPPVLTVPEIDVPLSRISIYRGQLSGAKGSQEKHPAAVAGAWKAANGNVAIALASINDQPVSISFDFDPAAYGLTGAGRIFRIDESARRQIGAFGGQATTLTLELPAGGAAVLEFTTSQQP